jgi:hypothetical protein
MTKLRTNCLLHLTHYSEPGFPLRDGEGVLIVCSHVFNFNTTSCM